MGRTLLKIIIFIVIVNVILNIARQVVKRLAPSVGDELSDEIKLVAIIDGISLKSEATAFRGGSARAIIGGIDLDLSAVTIDPEGAYLDLRAIVGGVRLIVPAGCNVETIGRAIAGGIDDQTVDVEMVIGQPLLLIEATAAVGGIQISYSPATGVKEAAAFT